MANSFAPSRAVIFDMDGVLVDGEPLHFAAARDVLAAQGATLDWDTYRHWIGETFDTIWPDIQSRFGLALSRATYEQAFGPLVQAQYEQHATALPGAAELLARLQAAGVPLGLASSTKRTRVDAGLQRLDFERYFQVTVAGDEVLRGKPAPEIYQAAATRLGLAPEHCLVLEDSRAGVAAGRAAGAQVVGVRYPAGAADALAEADRTIESLSEFDLAWVVTRQRRGAGAGV